MFASAVRRSLPSPWANGRSVHKQEGHHVAVALLEFLHQLGAVLCFAYGSSAQKATLSWYLPLDTPAAGSQAAGPAPAPPEGTQRQGRGQNAIPEWYSDRNLSVSLPTHSPCEVA